MKNFLKLSLLVMLLTGGVEMRAHEEPVETPVAKPAPEKLSTFSPDQQAKRQAIIEKSVASLGSDDHNKLIASSVKKILKMNNPDSGGLNLSDPAVTEIQKDGAGKITSVTVQHPATTFLQKTFSFPTPKTTITHNADGTHTAITTSSGLFGLFPKTTDPVVIHNPIKIENPDGSVYQKRVDDKTGEVHESIRTIGAADGSDTLYERKTYPNKAVVQMFQDTDNFESHQQTHPQGGTHTKEFYADGSKFEYSKNNDGSSVITHGDVSGTVTEESRNAQSELTAYQVTHDDGITETKTLYDPTGLLKEHSTTDKKSKETMVVLINPETGFAMKSTYVDGDGKAPKSVKLHPTDPIFKTLNNLSPELLPPATLAQPVAVNSQINPMKAL